MYGTFCRRSLRMSWSPSKLSTKMYPFGFVTIERRRDLSTWSVIPTQMISMPLPWISSIWREGNRQKKMSTLFMDFNFANLPLHPDAGWAPWMLFRLWWWRWHQACPCSDLRTPRRELRLPAPVLPVCLYDLQMYMYMYGVCTYSQSSFGFLQMWINSVKSVPPSTKGYVKVFLMKSTCWFLVKSSKSYSSFALENRTMHAPHIVRYTCTSCT